MATRIETPPSTGDRVPATAKQATNVQVEPSLGELIKELAQETSDLVRQEVELAKTEMTENTKRFATNAGLMAAGGAVLLVATLVLTAFLVAALGDLLGNEYWLGALIVGVIYGIIGGVLVARGKKGLDQESIKPERTIDSLQADGRWAKAEARQVKNDLTA